MNKTLDPLLRGLDDCGCGEGITVQTPMEVSNRPGLSAISYRVGTYTQFKQSMLARLSGMDSSALRSLQTRDDSDFTIALFDCWAMVCDVLTFYQERIANESYLRTAQEQFSLTYLARRIGYELHPGVAATTYLAFSIEDAAGAPEQTSIPAGTKVQSLPNPGEQPQIFETIETIDDARAVWNAIKPRAIQQQKRDQASLATSPQLVTQTTLPSSGTSNADNPPSGNGSADGNVSQQDAGTNVEPDHTLFLDGIATGLKPGDGLLIMPQTGDGSSAVFYQVMAVTPQPAKNWTRVALQKLPAAQPDITQPSQAPQPASLLPPPLSDLDHFIEQLPT